LTSVRVVPHLNLDRHIESRRIFVAYFRASRLIMG